MLKLKNLNDQIMIKNIVNKILLLSRVKKQFIMILVDVILLELSIILAYSLRQAGWFWPNASVEKLIYISPFLAIPIFYIFGLYSTVIRYISIKAFLFIIYAVSLYMVIWSLFGYFLNVKVPRSVLIYHDNGVIYKVSEYFSGFLVLCIIIWLISLLLIANTRFIVRQLLWSFQGSKFDKNIKSKNVLIYGAGDAGIQIATALKFARELNPVAFIDDKISLIGKYIENLKVFGFSDLDKLIKNFKIDEILIAIPSISFDKKSVLINNLSKFPVKVSILPGIVEIAEGKIGVEDLKSIKIEDVLGREQIPPIKHLLNSNIYQKNVIITGAGGSIGSELSRQIINLNPKKIIIFEQNEFALYKIENELKKNYNKKISQIIPILGNVCHKQKLINLFLRFNIDIVFHAAAYKHVPIVEKNISEGFRNNVLGTLSCVEAAIVSKVNNFVLISTDKAVRPTNIMGATKRLSEMIIQAYSNENYYNKEKIITKFSVVRFGNVLGSSGSVLPLFESQIKSGGPITLTHKDITRYFMTTKEASQLVIQASAIESNIDKGNLFVLDMGKPVKIFDLAKKMVELSGLKWKISPEQKGDIEIKVIGLRPGEKLYEELMIENESQETEHPKIIQIKEKYEPLIKIKKTISQFIDIKTEENDIRTKNLLKGIVKEYTFK